MSIAEEKNLVALGATFAPPSDREMESRIRLALDRSRYRALRRVGCAYRAGVLTLRGSVESYYIKQVAQCVALTQFRGGVVVDNQLTVAES